ncbi:hypothetical protein NKH72_21895 [Mesorhizobium sp. M0955]|uniref:hypothetical protein n=1 Tax=Mesorhizobium sp. M0955 TaxID=2957033 RepID=UPI003336F3AC
MSLIEAAPAGALMRPMLNGKSLGIIESNPEQAFSYWAGRARNGVLMAERAGERRPRVYTLQRVAWCRHRNDYVPSVDYRFVDGEWRAV